jgi:hypothetical protein
MTDTSKQQRKGEAGDVRAAAGNRGQRAPAPSAPRPGRNPSPNPPSSPQRSPAGTSDDDEERMQDIDDEEE